MRTTCRLKETLPLNEADELDALECPPSIAETVVILCTEPLDAPLPSVGRHPTLFAIVVQHTHAGQRHVRTLTPADGAHDGAASTGQLAKLLLHFDDRAATPAVLFTEVYAHALVAMEDGGVLG